MADERHRRQRRVVVVANLAAAFVVADAKATHPQNRKTQQTSDTDHVGPLKSPHERGGLTLAAGYWTPTSRPRLTLRGAIWRHRQLQLGNPEQLVSPHH